MFADLLVYIPLNNENEEGDTYQVQSFGSPLWTNGKVGGGITYLTKTPLIEISFPLLDICPFNLAFCNTTWEMSISFWFKASDPPSGAYSSGKKYCNMFTLSTNAIFLNVWRRLDAAASIITVIMRVRPEIINATDNSFAQTPTLVLDVWHQVFVTVASNGMASLHLDGAQINMYSSAQTPTFQNDASLKIGPISERSTQVDEIYMWSAYKPASFAHRFYEFTNVPSQ